MYQFLQESMTTYLIPSLLLSYLNSLFISYTLVDFSEDVVLFQSFTESLMALASFCNKRQQVGFP